jgi:uncharacterized pyridoxamine 5'-phosphate oxidase family protein
VIPESSRSRRRRILFEKADFLFFLRRETKRRYKEKKEPKTSFGQL